jgi:hypothetical protein
MVNKGRGAVEGSQDHQRIRKEFVQLLQQACKAAISGPGGGDFKEAEVGPEHSRVRIAPQLAETSNACRGASTARRCPHESTIEAIWLAGNFEALALDPVYSGKGLAGLIALIRDGRCRRKTVSVKPGMVHVCTAS